jgi:hypothetical protein
MGCAVHGTRRSNYGNIMLAPLRTRLPHADQGNWSSEALSGTSLRALRLRVFPLYWTLSSGI